MLFIRRVWKKNIRPDLTLYLMALPAVLALIIFSYIPMLGLVMAFQNLNIRKGIFGSDFVGFNNFKFLFTTTDAWVITRNTVCYNAVFIVLNMFLSVLLALLLNEMRGKRLAKVLQTVFIMPNFLSMTVVAIIVFSILSPTNGFLNNLLLSIGYSKHSWYMEPQYWPFILVIVNAWKHVGYSAVVYLASITSIPMEHYEAAIIDGANRRQQAWYITFPHLKVMMSILLIMSVGNIFRGDFGLFYTVPQNTGTLFPVTDVIDTYIYRSLMTLNNVGMATAAGLYQSAVGLVLVLVTNRIIKKISPDNAMF